MREENVGGLPSSFEARGVYHRAGTGSPSRKRDGVPRLRAGPVGSLLRMRMAEELSVTSRTPACVVTSRNPCGPRCVRRMHSLGVMPRTGRQGLHMRTWHMRTWHMRTWHIRTWHTRAWHMHTLSIVAAALLAVPSAALAQPAPPPAAQPAPPPAAQPAPPPPPPHPAPGPGAHHAPRTNLDWNADHFHFDYDDGSCRLVYEYNFKTGDMHLDRHGDCSYVNIPHP
jgi:hypothetical protein